MHSPETAGQADIQPLMAQAMCPHCLPLSVPETLTHMLLECPVAITVWDWICRLWAAYSGAQAPPATAAVLLADDQREWSPPQDLQASWLQLRIAAIAALSSAARGRRRGLPTGAASVASTVVHAVRTAVSRDWQRVVAGDPALLASGICCSSWLRGRHPYMSQEQFLATWARNGAFCTVFFTYESSQSSTAHRQLSSQPGHRQYAG